MKQVRGIRNNNPANIRRGSNWRGLVPFLIDPTNNQRYYDKSFCQFESMELGLRALFVLLRTYHYKYHLNTIGRIIHRYAPLSENNTYSYIANVCRWMTELYDINEFLTENFYIRETDTFSLFNNPKSPTFFCKCLVKCICRQESGYELDELTITKAINLI